MSKSRQSLDATGARAKHGFKTKSKEVIVPAFNTLKPIYERTFQEFLGMKFTVKALKPGYKVKPNKSYIECPVDALNHARASMLYEWFLDNNVYDTIEDLYEYILLPETPVELEGISIKELVYVLSPETRRICEKL